MVRGRDRAHARPLPGGPIGRRSVRVRDVLVRALTWNLFHGRDHAPDPALHTRRSRLRRVTERGSAHAQVNRDLLAEFSSVLAAAEWDVALLQECPPRWAASLARACEAEAQVTRTARNWVPPLQAALARLNPDLVGSWEGGSNTTLVRSGVGPVLERRQLVIRQVWPERRTMGFARLGAGVSVANLHASHSRPRMAEGELVGAARTALEWAKGSPLIFGGDLNVRAAESDIFGELERLGLRAPTEATAIDHLLVRGLEIVEPPRAWPAGDREVREGDLRIRLSDHAPVQAVFRIR
jgi:endonuclease/exonuclease/phosphatase family metal-dependent hydrolase